MLEAKIKAEHEYEKFRVIQDREYESDFDKEIKKFKKNNFIRPNKRKNLIYHTSNILFMKRRNILKGLTILPFAGTVFPFKSLLAA